MDYLNYFLPEIKNLGIFWYWLVLIVSLLESLAFVGVIIPGSLLVITAGFLSAYGYFDISDLIWFTAIGAVIGDGISYYFGTKGTRFFHNENKILKLSHLDRGKNFFKKHGIKSLFLGRFIGSIRPIISFVAGLSKMNHKSFIFWNVFSSFLWASVNLFLGYFFGEATRSIEVWSTKTEVFLLFLFLILIFIWLIIKKSSRFFEFVISIIVSVKEAILRNKEVRELIKNHPIFISFARQRLNIRKFSGLPLTFLVIAFLYMSSILFGVAKNIITSGPIIAVDARVENLLYAFRDFELVKIFTWITVLAKWKIILSFGITASIILWLWKRKLYIISLWVTIAGSSLSNIIGKIAFHRHRPETALYAENTFSFPSGHSTMAVSFFGFIIYLLLKRARKWEYKMNIFFLGSALILIIGLSRIYLGVHFLSDVWGGYLLGFLWLVVGIVISEWLNSIIKPTSYSPSRRIKITSFFIIGVVVAFYGVFAFYYNPEVIKRDNSLEVVIISDAFDFLRRNTLPRFTETLIGESQEPISFIIAVKDDQRLIDNMMSGGWYLADKVDVSSVARLVKYAISKEDYPKAPISPSFWNYKVNDFGFEKPTEANNVHERHHARFWRTQFETVDGNRLYVGAASFDIGMKWFMIHKINPDIDTEREVLFSDLEKAGVVLSYEKQQSVKPALGKNFSGDQFFTDGKLYSIVLK